MRWQRLVGGILALLLVVLAAAACSAGACAEAPAHRAVLIVEYGDGRSEAFCVPFEQESITGIELLQRSGLAVGMESGGLGLQVCQIDDVGCRVGKDPCFCQCLGSACTYWSYFQWRDGQWVYSPVGAGLRTVRDGDADAWVWGDGKTLPSLTPEGICEQETPVLAATEVTAIATASAAERSPAPPQSTAQKTGQGGRQVPAMCGSAVIAPLALALLRWPRRAGRR